jgi:DUF1680 family protein
MNTLDSAQRAHVVDTSGSPHAHLRTLPLEAVSLADDFWEPRRRINREVTLPSQYRHLEETGRLDNFRRASGKIGGEYQGIYFNDSDVYKWLEAASWALAEGPDPDLSFVPGLLGGVVVQRADARAAAPDAGWEDRLYRTVHPREGDTQTKATRVTTLPYYAWANREQGAMRVWLRNG